MASKPAIASYIRVAEGPAKEEIGAGELLVVNAYDSLDDDWGDYGEFAVAMKDIDTERKGEWYVVVAGNLNDIYCLASYEVEQE